MGAVVFFVDVESILARRLPAVEARLTERLGRPVSLGTVRVELWPARVEISGLRVAGRSPSAPPLLEAPSARARVATRPFLFSLGRRLEIEDVHLEAPVIQVSRAADGSWSFADLADALGTPAPTPEGRVEIALSRLSIEQGRVMIRDRQRGATLRVGALSLRASGLERGTLLDVDLRALLQDGERASPLSLSARRVDLEDARAGRALPRGSVALEVESLAVAPWLGLLPARELSPTSGIVDGTLTLSLGRAGRVEAEGALRFSGLTMRGSSRAPLVQGVSGDVELRGGRPLAVRFEVAGPRLDLDTLEHAATGDAGRGLSPGVRRLLAQLDATGTFAFERATAQGIPMRDVRGRARVARGEVVFESLAFEAYGGRADASGTRLALDDEIPAWALQATLTGLDLGEALADQTELDGVFQGTVGAHLDVQGRGLTHAALEQSLQGRVIVDGERLQWRTLDVAAATLAQLRAVAEPVLEGLPRVPRGGTTLQRFRAPLRLEDGRFVLEAPLAADTTFGALSLEGSAGFQGDLALRAQATLTPEAVRRWTSGLLVPSRDVRLPLRIGGTFAEPRITVLELGPLFEVALETGFQRGAAPLLEDLEERAGQELRRELRRVLEPPR